MSTYCDLTKNFKTIIDFLRFGLSKARHSNLYYGHGTDNAWDDIWMLIVESLSLPIDVDPILLTAILTEDEKTHLAMQLEQRIEKRIPVPYLTNKSYFCNLEFYVDDRVLIPRSPIAELINQQFSPWIDGLEVKRILDLCTGSGCIGIACCYAFPDALVDAVDISSAALDVAAINQQKHDLKDSLTLIESNCFEGVPKVKYDIIVSNPPYVGNLEMQTLPNEYKHEPKLALETENNGLLIVDNILKNAGKYLAKDGILVVEVGNTEEALLEAYPEVPFSWVDFEHGGSGVFILTYDQIINL